MSVLTVAARLGDVHCIEQVVRDGGDINACDGEGTTALATAALHNRLEVVKYLASIGADLTKSDERRLAPVVCAASKGHLAVCKYLLDGLRTLPEAETQLPLAGRQAARHGHVPVLQMFAATYPQAIDHDKCLQVLGTPQGLDCDGRGL